MMLGVGCVLLLAACTSDRQPPAAASSGPSQVDSSVPTESSLTAQLLDKLAKCEAIANSGEARLCIGTLNGEEVQPALDRAFAQVMAALPPDRAPLLSESQQAWEHYVTVDCDLAGRRCRRGSGSVAVPFGVHR
jgi:uncharacterized protein YecT (DUF1311 family)